MPGRHAGEFMGVPPTHRLVAFDQVLIVRNIRTISPSAISAPPTMLNKPVDSTVDSDRPRTAK
jgi:hypothetical protein